MVTHTGITALARTQVERFEVDTGSQMFQFASPSFDAAVLKMCAAFGAGAALIVPPPEPLAGEPLATVLIPPAALVALAAAAVPQSGGGRRGVPAGVRRALAGRAPNGQHLRSHQVHGGRHHQPTAPRTRRCCAPCSPRRWAYPRWVWRSRSSNWAAIHCSPPPWWAESGPDWGPSPKCAPGSKRSPRLRWPHGSVARRVRPKPWPAYCHSAPPLFGVYPGQGIGWVYAGLLAHLDSSVPVYALQARGLAGPAASMSGP